jgi:hypothetical protein
MQMRILHAGTTSLLDAVVVGQLRAMENCYHLASKNGQSMRRQSNLPYDRRGHVVPARHPAV